MIDSEIKSDAFRVAQLRSECTRVKVLLGVCGSLLLLVLARGVMSLAGGHKGEAWPFALILAIMTAYEVVWLRFVSLAVKSSREITQPTWAVKAFVESLLPTSALLLQLYTPTVGPHRALTSPAVLVYFLFIVLSTLHLSPELSRLTGVFSAAGYIAFSIYAFLQFPRIVSDGELLVYGTAFAYSAILLLAGFAAGAVALQIRLHVIAALREAEGRTKLENELLIARSIQQGLFPKAPPRIEGFDIAGWNRPAEETGGDYFDWQQLADGRVAVTVADVTGHGIGSALGMAACRAYARAGFTTETSLRSFLCRLNQLLYQDLPAEKFVTLAAGVLNPAEGTLKVVSAGHGPLLFYSSAQDCFRSDDAQGPPLGLLPEICYGGPRTLKFAPGDILVWVTDGFIEWANATDEDFGQNRLKDVIRTYRDMPSEKIICELYSAVQKFAGSTPQLDDLTALVVKRKSNGK